MQAFRVGLPPSTLFASLALLAVVAAACAGRDAVRRDDVIVPMKLDALLTTAAIIAGEPARAAGLKSEFRVGDEAVICLVRFRHCIGQHQLVFRWYDPQDKLYAQSDDIRIDPPGEYHEAVSAWHRINLAKERAASMPGDWTVTVFMDGSLVGSTRFRITL